MTRGAERLRAWREASGLSQGQAAKRVGASQGAWSAWEAGRKRPSIEQIVKLAAITASSEHAVTLHDFVESAEEAEERRSWRKTAP